MLFTRNETATILSVDVKKRENKMLYSRKVGKISDVAYRSAGADMKCNSIWEIEETVTLKCDYKNDMKVDTFAPENIVVRYGELKIPTRPAKSFEELDIHPSILEWLYVNELYSPNMLQQILLPHLIRNRWKKDNTVDVIVHAGRKAGKTTAALISLSTSLAFSDSNLSKAVIICPTFESANIIFQVGQTITKHCPKLTFRQEMRKQNNKKITENVIIGTPEKIKHLMANKLIDAKEVDVVVFDEFHMMISNREHTNPLLTITEFLPKTNQLIMLSSSISDECMKKFVEAISKKRFCPFSVETCIEQPSMFKAKQFFISSKNMCMKKELLEMIVTKRTNQIAVICSSKINAEDLYNYIRKIEDLSVSVLIGKLSPMKRQSVIEDFKMNKIKVLITTPNFTDLRTPNLKTIVCYDHFFTKDWQIHDQSYQKWMDVINDSKGSLIINFMEERYANHLFKINKNLPVLEPDKLEKKLDEFM